jgi:hypothetical protein
MFVCLIFGVYLTAGCLTLIRSRSSYNHTYKHAYLCVYVYIYMFFFVCVFLIIPDSWLPNSLVLLDTGIFICPTISCRPCHPAFLPGFPRFGECVFLVAVDRVVCLRDSVDCSVSMCTYEWISCDSWLTQHQMLGEDGEDLRIVYASIRTHGRTCTDRRTDTVDGSSSEIVAAHRLHTRTPLRCG